MSEKNHDFGNLVCIYAQLLPRIKAKAKELGYALAIHGSMNRDLDLLAVPWIEEAAAPPVLIQAIADEAGCFILGDLEKRAGLEGPTKQPHGRLSWNLCWGGKPFIDIGVMPMIKQPGYER